MTALSDLTTTEVRFRERIRGYDYDEVDSYVKAANNAAVQAHDRIAELEERLSLSESRAGGDESESETRDMLVRTLVLAQRTADAAVADARSEAKTITDAAREQAHKTVSEAEAAADSQLRSAQERATQTLAEGEENCRLIIAETKRTAAAEMASEREQALEEIRALEAFKTEMETTTASIQTRFDGLRLQLRSLLASFRSFVDEIDPETGVDESETQPEIPAIEAPMTELLIDNEPDGAPEAAEPAAVEALDAAEPEAAAVEALDAAEPEAVEALDPAEPEAAEALDAAEPGAGQEAEGPVDETAEAAVTTGPQPPPESAPQFLIDPDGSGQPAGEGPESLAAPDFVPEVPIVRWLDEDDVGLPGDLGGEAPLEDSAPARSEAGSSPDSNGSPDPEPTGHQTALTSVVTNSGASAGPDAPELFDVDADEDDEFIEQLRRVVSSDAPLPATDAAMAAFFDHDENAGRGGAGLGRGGWSGQRA